MGRQRCDDGSQNHPIYWMLLVRLSWRTHGETIGFDGFGFPLFGITSYCGMRS